MDEPSSNQNLELVVVNGPLAGQTFSFMPKSKIHIGRVVRGNNLTIKDTSISSKHLSIILDLDIGRWMVSDLESSNGTFLNGRALDPFHPTELSDGDVIKIGELTSILVKWRAQEVVEKVEKLENVGRKACVKGGRSKKNAQKLEEKEGKDLEDMDELRKNDGKGEEMVGSRVEQENISGVCENLVLEQNEGLKMVTRGRRKKEKISGVCENLVLEQNEGSKMVTRGRRKKENLQVAMVELNEKQEMSVRRTAESTKEAKVLENHGENAGQQADLKKRKGRRGKNQNVEAETLTEIVQVEKQDVAKEVRAENMPVNEVIDISKGGAIVDPLVEAETLTKIVQVEKEDVILLNSGSKLDEIEDARDYDNMPVNEVKVTEIREGGAIDDPLVEAETLTGIVQVEKEDIILHNSGSKLDETEDNARNDDNMPLNEVIFDPLVEEEHVNCSVAEGSPSLPSSKDHNDFGLDLENMTLGDLFDHWEVSLPKQIIDASELMISDMRQKSKKYHEFRLQHKSAKD